MQEFKDGRAKYIDMRKDFELLARELSITAKVQLRTCEALAKRLASDRPKDKQEEAKNEYYRDFIIKTAQMNDQVLTIVEHARTLFNEIAVDYDLFSTSLSNDTIRLQSETILFMNELQDKLINDLYECRKNQITA